MIFISKLFAFLLLKNQRQEKQTEWNKQKKDVELFGRGSKTKTQVYLWL